jgi:hypothetical protein
MQSTNMRQIKAALWDQAFIGGTRVSCPMGDVVAISRRKGQLVALMRGWGRWYPVERVRIEYAGRQLLSETTGDLGQVQFSREQQSHVWDWLKAERRKQTQ